MARQRISLADTITPPAPTPVKAVTPKPKPAPKRETRPAPPVKRPDPVEVRKETFLRPGVITELDEIARSLQRSARKGERRITSNTLIRVAVDQLLAERSHLRGSTEAELLTSINKRTSRTSN